jgi:MFS family permease
VTALSLLSGVVTDRVDRRRLLILVQSVMMGLSLVLAALTLWEVVRFWHVVVLATAMGVANAFDMTARQSFTVEMVGKDDLMNAIALNSSIFNGARLLGPALAGLLVEHVGEALAFALNGLSFLAVLAGLLLQRLPPFQPPPGRARPLAELADGVRFIRSHRTVLALVLAVCIPSMFGFSFTTLVPVVASEVLGLEADGFGALVSAMGVGALVAALSLAALGHLRPKGRLLTLATFVFALAVLGFGLSEIRLVSMLLLGLAGWGMIAHLATTNTLIQIHVPDALRGRVMGTYLWIVVGLAPLGNLFYGSLAERLGAPAALVAGASLCLAGAVGSFVLMPRLRRLP